jgi:hypothetical protein
VILIVVVVAVSCQVRNRGRPGNTRPQGNQRPGNARPGNVRPFLVDDEFCMEYPGEEWPMEGECERYWYCDESGRIEEECPPGWVFDTVYMFCGRFLLNTRQSKSENS